MNQENRPLVTAVIPVYNHENYVVESIRSIIRQTYRNLELIVINDGSKDKSHEKILTVVEECRQRFVQFEYINRENVGISATLNQALSMSRGEYLTVQDSDDVAFPERIELLVNALEVAGPAYAVAFGNALIIDGNGEKVRLDKAGCISTDANAYENFIDFYTRHRNFNYRGSDFGTYRSLVLGNYLPSMSSVIRTAAISEVGGWTEGNAIEDWEMWLKLSKAFKFFYVDRPLAFYRWHEFNTAKTAVGGLTFASLFLIDREKKYCRENSLASAWHESHNSLVYDAWINRQLPAKLKLSLLKNTDETSLLLFAIRRWAGRLRRYSRQLTSTLRVASKGKESENLQALGSADPSRQEMKFKLGSIRPPAARSASVPLHPARSTTTAPPSPPRRTPRPPISNFAPVPPRSPASRHSRDARPPSGTR